MKGRELALAPALMVVLVLAGLGEGLPSEREGTFVQVLRRAPFPYTGKYGETDVDFFDFVDPRSGRRFHTNRHGERYSEEEHYGDGSVLFHIPPRFDPRKDFLYVVFFHGLGTDIMATSREHELTRQVDLSGKNVILVVPQLAKHAADSSPGKFFMKNGFRDFMREVAEVVASRVGISAPENLQRAPIFLSAFSGGYKSVAYILEYGGVSERLTGVFLMDALYEDVDKFERWVAESHARSFLVSLHAPGTCRENMRELLNRLAGRGIEARDGWPQSSLRSGVYTHECKTDHLRIPSVGPPKYPLACLLKLLGTR